MNGMDTTTGIMVKQSTRERYAYMRVLTSRRSLPWALHLLKKTKAYRRINTAKSIKYFIRYFIASLLSTYCPIQIPT